MDPFPLWLALGLLIALALVISAMAGVFIATVTKRVLLPVIAGVGVFAILGYVILQVVLALIGQAEPVAAVTFS